MNALYCPARAKLNLVLRIVGRRADGYHLLETLFHTLDLHDDLWLARRASGCELEVRAEQPHSNWCACCKSCTTCRWPPWWMAPGAWSNNAYFGCFWPLALME